MNVKKNEDQTKGNDCVKCPLKPQQRKRIAFNENIHTETNENNWKKIRIDLFKRAGNNRVAREVLCKSKPAVSEQ